MGLIQLLFSNPLVFVGLTVLLLYSVIVHEVAHGWVAHLFGDDTALRYGRLTLNPLHHLDPLGTLMLFFVGFGWAKPVPVDYYRLQRSRFGFVSVSLAGCLANILIATSALLLLNLPSIHSNQILSLIFAVVARINIILGAFNLIPIPPLDGSKILMSFLPQQAKEKFMMLEPYGFFILAFLLFTGILDPVIVFMQQLIYGMISVIFRLA
ncbi:MAG: site-2 protease family protein [Candidatus Omnitrophica bacterium]|nr:site-2 protease family protein [Candidatus Omnitrophota bacterium]